MSTLKEVLALLDELGLPYVQIQWSPASAPDLPYVVLVPQQSRPTPADNTVNYLAVRYSIELYTRYRDMELEARIQAALEQAGIYYSRATTVIPDGYAILTRYSVLLYEDVSAPSS